MLEQFFNPQSVAVVGASRTPGKVGHDVLENLIDAGFDGPLYPINPKADEVQGLTAYSDVTEIGQPVDLAIIVIPSKYVLDVIDQCAEAGVGAVIVISAGFKEVGEEGAELERELARRCRRHGIRCIGPNCLGVISPPAGLNASFAATMPSAGNVAILSQSGALGTAVLDWFDGEEGQGLGISRFISYGNKADVDESDLIQALGQDVETDVILAYVESIDDGQKFMDIAREVTPKKPVVIFKSGRTSAGARAASSHTGSLAGSDRAYDAAFHQCGVLRAESAAQFFDYLIAFSRQNPPQGPSIAVVTNAGGPGIMATDAIESTHLQMATLSETTTELFQQNLPAESNIHNPVDVIGDAKSDRYETAIDGVIDDPGVDALLTILTPQTSTEIEKTARVLGMVAEETDKTILASFMGGKCSQTGGAILRDVGVPNFPHPERAVAMLDGMYRYSARGRTTDEPAPDLDFDDAAIENALTQAARAGMDELGERQAQQIIRSTGLRLPETTLAPDADSAARAAEQTGYPVVMKISSDDILHKSDAGGVKVGLEDPQQVRDAFDTIMDSARTYDPEAQIDGVLVQEMITGGTEVIVGMNRDPQFGPLIMFGLGGIYVEVLKDVAFRVAPLTADDAREMIEEIQSAEILKGFRGEEPRDLDALADAILRLSQLAVSYPQLAECDMNPLLVFAEGEGVATLDMRFRLEHD